MRCLNVSLSFHSLPKANFLGLQKGDEYAISYTLPEPIMSGHRAEDVLGGQEYSSVSDFGHYPRFKSTFSHFLGLGIHALTHLQFQMTQIT